MMHLEHIAKMNVSKWWKAPISTKYCVKMEDHKNVHTHWQRKGLKTLLEEGVINIKMNKEGMINVLREMRDFEFQKNPSRSNTK